MDMLTYVVGMVIVHPQASSLHWVLEKVKMQNEPTQILALQSYQSLLTLFIVTAP